MKRSKDLDFTFGTVVGLADEYHDGFEDPRHSHERVQLLFACTGVMSVIATNTAIVLPPQRALWIPAGVEHAVSCRGPVSLRTVYIDPDAASRESTCHVFEVRPFLRALILEITESNAEPADTARNQKVSELFLMELASAQTVPCMTPLPHDAKLLRVCNLIV
ncbi:MAG: AraC family ligand binding domain-containing protein, partial [Pseudomonadota bacterium]